MANPQVGCTAKTSVKATCAIPREAPTAPASGNRHRLKEKRTAHQDAQPGADVRPETAVVGEDDLPAGLKRERKGPLSPSSGRR